MTAATATNVIGLHRMTEAEYERERQKLRQTYGENAEQAGIRWEQELARLFYRSGWTQGELAVKENKSQSWIVCQLRFGRFMDFITTVIKTEMPTFLINERNFRGFWERTKGDERDRFREVLRLIEEAEVMLRKPQRPRIGKKIVEQFGDGKWYRPEDIAEELDTDTTHVVATIENLRARRIAGVETQSAKHEANKKYRICSDLQTISLADIVTKLTPIINDLRRFAAQKPGTISNGSVDRSAGQLQNLLKEWREANASAPATPKHPAKKTVAGVPDDVSSEIC